MGAASTVACIAEALGGMSLPGTAAIPAVHADRLVAEETGKAAVRLIESKGSPCGRWPDRSAVGANANCCISTPWTRRGARWPSGWTARRSGSTVRSSARSTTRSRSRRLGCAQRQPRPGRRHFQARRRHAFAIRIRSPCGRVHQSRGSLRPIDHARACGGKDDCAAAPLSAAGTASVAWGRGGYAPSYLAASAQHRSAAAAGLHAGEQRHFSPLPWPGPPMAPAAFCSRAEGFEPSGMNSTALIGA